MVEGILRDKEARYKGYLIADSTVKGKKIWELAGQGILPGHRGGVCAEQNSGLRNQIKHFR